MAIRAKGNVKRRRLRAGIYLSRRETTTEANPARVHQRLIALPSRAAGITPVLPPAKPATLAAVHDAPATMAVRTDLIITHGLTSGHRWCSASVHWTTINHRRLAVLIGAPIRIHAHRIHHDGLTIRIAEHDFSVTLT